MGRGRGRGREGEREGEGEREREGEGERGEMRAREGGKAIIYTYLRERLYGMSTLTDTESGRDRHGHSQYK